MTQNEPLHFLCSSPTDPGFLMRFSEFSFCGVLGVGIGVKLCFIGGKLDEACTLPITLLFLQRIQFKIET